MTIVVAPPHGRSGVSRVLSVRFVSRQSWRSPWALRRTPRGLCVFLLCFRWRSGVSRGGYMYVLRCRTAPWALRRISWTVASSRGRPGVSRAASVFTLCCCDVSAPAYLTC